MKGYIIKDVAFSPLGEFMKKMSEEAAKELWKVISRNKELEIQFANVCDKLELAYDMLRAYVGYLNSHLTETEKLLVDKTKELLGEDNGS
jgi:5'-deoxynucleotidase YfbR-like HD superfamily hydrolase